jgi:hypothetical protein
MLLNFLAFLTYTVNPIPLGSGRIYPHFLVAVKGLKWENFAISRKMSCEQIPLTM